MHRFLVESLAPGDPVPRTFSLSPEDAHHALSVLRLRPGDQAEVIAGARRFLCVLSSSGPGGVTLSPLSVLPDTEPAIRITLFQGLPKAEKMDLIIRMGVELGISRFVPVVTARSVVRLTAKDAARRTERWQKIAREACKQSGRSLLPEVMTPLSLSQALPLLRRSDLAVVPWEECPAGGPYSVFREHPACSSLAMVIGPEGGLTREEVSSLRQADCLPITLGPRILRTETAGPAAAAAFLALYGQMEGPVSLTEPSPDLPAFPS